MVEERKKGTNRNYSKRFKFIQNFRCFGDSGSGLIVDGKVVGVVSWGVPCAVGNPDMYGRVDAAHEWITANTGV